MTYTPMCAYVPNYRCVQSSTTSQPTTAQKTISPKPNQPSTITSNQNQQGSAPQNPKSLNTSEELQGVNAPKEPKTVTVLPKETAPVTTPAKHTVTSPQTRNGGETPSPTSATSVPQKEEDECDESDILPDDIPPSYDDLFGSGEEENVSQDDDLVEKGFFMLVRFPNDRKTEFMKAMKDNRCSLQKFRGNLSAVQSKELFRKGTWPENTALSILSFSTKEMACDWLKSTPVVSNENWLGSCDIIIVESDELFQESHRSLVLSVSSRLPTFNLDDQKKMVSIINTHLKPARLVVGGVTVSSAKKDAEILQGSWDTSSNYVSLMLFRKSQDMGTYKKSVDPEMYQEFERLRDILYETVHLLVINLEDLTLWYENEEQEL